MLRKNYFLFLLIFIVNITTYSLKFYPLNYDKRIDKEGAYGEFTLTNTSKEPIRYKIDSKTTGKSTDISRLVTIYPKVITIEPFSEKSFKVFVDETNILKNGEYSFILGIKPLKMPQLEEIKGMKTNSNLSIKQALNLEMFAYVGDLEKPFEIITSKFYKENRKDKYKARIKNSTGRGYELAVGFVDSKNMLMSQITPLGRLFNNNQADINVEIPKNAKKIVFYDYNNFKVLKQVIEI